MLLPGERRGHYRAPRAKSPPSASTSLKGSFATLTVAGRELNKVARRHAARFVKENSTIAVDAGKDVSALARTTYATLAKRAAAAAEGAQDARRPQARSPQGRLSVPPSLALGTSDIGAPLAGRTTLFNFELRFFQLFHRTGSANRF